jgi:hypothetical protein
MENSKRIMVAREKRAITNYYIYYKAIPSKKKNVFDFNPTVEKQYFALRK